MEVSWFDVWLCQHIVLGSLSMALYIIGGPALFAYVVMKYHEKRWKREDNLYAISNIHAGDRSVSGEKHTRMQRPRLSSGQRKMLPESRGRDGDQWLYGDLLQGETREK